MIHPGIHYGSYLPTFQVCLSSADITAIITIHFLALYTSAAEACRPHELVKRVRMYAQTYFISVLVSTEVFSSGKGILNHSEASVFSCMLEYPQPPYF